MTKHDGKYYMQYAAPGTEFNVYADGVYVADNPLGPYRYQPHNPVSYKPGGFMNGAGHGSTVVGPGGRYWHFASMSLSATVNWERRLCMFPTFFDGDGIMYCDNRALAIIPILRRRYPDIRVSSLVGCYSHTANR